VARRRMAVDVTKAGVRTEPPAAGAADVSETTTRPSDSQTRTGGRVRHVSHWPGPARSKVIVFTPADSVTCARTRRAKTQVSTAFGVIFLLISGLGVRFPRGAQMASEQGKRYELRILAVISGFRHGPVRAARQAADLREREASSRQRLAQRSYSV
jgi:hypothetical protein